MPIAWRLTDSVTPMEATTLPMETTTLRTEDTHLTVDSLQPWAMELEATVRPGAWE